MKFNNDVLLRDYPLTYEELSKNYRSYLMMKIRPIYMPSPGAEKAASPGRENLEVTVGGGWDFSEILKNLKKK